ncbi:hypothetical protein HanRHA438_Chr13g0579221 [Helianthus annuus]|uniref:Uncharacterized protein n=1 Tax=Helianthus annuus TaxID=4232 RepID=A0A9K3EEJ9_HELAN|nr:hypothetical protein HanXRQr2_Chr13g0567671 [Helianthus annuus]KAJ0475412.1 hypothetical protein HanHA300_Chr13g0465161 [Helianthus annuus]KAJ0479296.1 hypothetical protein HanIR_Chr13g0618411 [Helianthus annuus]KAJ0496217.1 hypothetical protein HanHA89_Chr13g0497191 [Helianthus annuus]KAJ0662290.1 hypothetical protein HanLR1_Chr13g0467771 [Helianthus annuus]
MAKMGIIKKFNKEYKLVDENGKIWSGEEVGEASKVAQENEDEPQKPNQRAHEATWPN